MSVLEEPLVFVDIETNGLSHSRGRIIEVAAVRIEKDFDKVEVFTSVINPRTEIPYFITSLTGIKSDDVAGAPAFEEIADELLAFMGDAVFVAHNVRFDYAFLKQEFRRVGKRFSPKLLCTVRLSQALYPGQRGHKLQNVIERCGIEVKKRHRAYDDAYAILEFLRHAKANFTPETLTAAIKQQLKTPSLPKGLSRDMVASLPDEPGVYIFQDEAGNPLYIGKSINIKQRVLSHFNRDHDSTNEFKISQNVTNIEVRQTAGELEALLLESRLIKEMQPIYNRQLRRNQKLTLARFKTDDNGYMTITIEDIDRIDPENTDDILAVYPTKGRARSYLDQAIKDHLLCPKLMGFEKGRHGCFLYQLKKCEGACVGLEAPAQYNARLMDYFASKRIENWPYGSPVIIEEKHPAPAVPAKSIVVDQWCVVADIIQEEECSPVVSFYDRAFDIDTYKILRSYMRDKLHNLSVTPISRSHLSSLVANESGN